MIAKPVRQARDERGGAVLTRDNGALGAAFDPATGLLYVNANEMAWILRLVERPKTEGRTSGRELYLANCASCHKFGGQAAPANADAGGALG